MLLLREFRRKSFRGCNYSMLPRRRTNVSQFGVLFYNVVSTLLPNFVGSRLRAFLLKNAGYHVGPGTVIWGTIKIYGNSRLSIGEHCHFNLGASIDLTQPVEIGNRVDFGFKVSIFTDPRIRMDAAWYPASNKIASVIIGDGAWLATGCVICPGVTVGKGAIVAAGALVCTDVPDNALVAGVPSKVIRYIDPLNLQYLEEA
jgi:maltose O-acetyltransferase